ncbi:MAG: zinc-binding dehydrogenase [Sphingomonadaceae bacterium]|nr:zinc-binding dehydrogenase [Sphingomonadaceae bacterium]
MRAMVCHRLTPDRSGLAFEADWPEPPPPGLGEVTVAVAHAALNYPDVLMLAGGYQYAPPLPFIPGVEGAGTIVATGPGVSPERIGQVVVVGARAGLLAERITVPASAVRPLPGLPLAEAAAFTVAALTAYVALVRRGRLTAGERVAVTGAGGGTGLAAIALARALGAEVTALVSTAAKGEAAAAAGAGEVVIVPRGAPLPPLPPVDVVFDPVGGALAPALIAALARRGRYLIIGFVGGIPSVPTGDLVARELEVIGVRAGEYARQDPAGGRANLAAIDALAPRLAPHIGLRVPLDRSPDAFAAMAEGRLTGKAVIDL